MSALNKHRKSRTMTYAIAMLICMMVSLSANAQSTTDSVFLSNASEVIFKCNETKITPKYYNYLIKDVVPSLRVLGKNSIIIGRSAASPEGPYLNNKRLANGRRETIKSIISREGIDVDRIRFDTAIEEYALLVEMMRQNNDPDYEYVKAVVDSCGNNDILTKSILKKAQNGALFPRLKFQYFPQLRAVRIMVYAVPEESMINAVALQPVERIKGDFTYPVLVTEPEVDYESIPRREIFSIKTNLAMYGAYVPKYGYCPMPNVSVEYYPRHGHFAWQGDFDCPWWIGNTTNHKYFELRNYTLESRFYTRSSNKSYTNGLPNGKAAFKGFYLSAYTHAFLYQIGCNKDDGWIGEGIGAGIGLGYVFPLSKRNQHWRLEIGAQAGYFITKYDPFVYGCPVENIEDGLYYYDYTGDADLFKKRQYRFNWFGPTRVGITLTYDLFYRRIAKKGISFKRWEKKGGAR